jgi:hypothetical protein
MLLIFFYGSVTFREEQCEDLSKSKILKIIPTRSAGSRLAASDSQTVIFVVLQVRYLAFSQQY